MTKPRVKQIATIVLCLFIAVSLIPAGAAASYSPASYDIGTYLLDCGGGHTLYASEGSLWAWGRGTSGQLGNGNSLNAALPVRVASFMRSCAAGQDTSYAVDYSGNLYAWGENAKWKAADRQYQSSTTPVLIGGGFVSVAAAGDYAFALDAQGKLYAWGRFPSWFSAFPENNTPVEILSDVSGVFCNDDGIVIAMQSGQTSIYSETQTMSITVPGGVVSGAVYDGGSFVVSSDATLYGWGPLAGDGEADTLVQVDVNVAQVVCAEGTAFFLYNNADLYAVGENGGGQAGTGNEEALTAPALILRDVSAIDASGQFAAAVKSNGEVWTWGQDTLGQLGNGAAGLSYNIPFLILEGNGQSNPSGQPDQYSIAINGRQLFFDSSPINRSGRVLVPFRAIFEALGARVEWDAQTYTATAYGEKGDVIEIRPGDLTASINGAAYTLDVPAEIVSSRTLVPVRFVSEALGAQVDYAAPARLVDIRTGDYITEPVSEEDSMIGWNVYIEAGNSRQRWSATGVVVDSSGIILTNHHVVEGATWIKTYIGDTLYTQYDIYHVDTKRDFAIYRIRGDYPLNLDSAVLGDFDSLAVGDDLVSCGNPRGVRDQIARGQVVALYFLNLDSPGSMLTSVPAQPGSSGSGMYDSNLLLIGVVWGSNDEGDLSVCVPISFIYDFIAQAAEFYELEPVAA